MGSPNDSWTYLVSTNGGHNHHGPPLRHQSHSEHCWIYSANHSVHEALQKICSERLPGRGCSISVPSLIKSAGQKWPRRTLDDSSRARMACNDVEKRLRWWMGGSDTAMKEAR